MAMMRETDNEAVYKKAMEVVEQINSVMEKIRKKVEGT